MYHKYISWSTLSSSAIESIFVSFCVAMHITTIDIMGFLFTPISIVYPFQRIFYIPHVHLNSYHHMSAHILYHSSISHFISSHVNTHYKSPIYISFYIIIDFHYCSHVIQSFHLASSSHHFIHTSPFSNNVIIILTS